MPQVDIYEFVALLEYIGGDKFMEAEKKEVRFLTELLDDFRQFQDEIWQFSTEFLADP